MNKDIVVQICSSGCCGIWCRCGGGGGGRRAHQDFTTVVALLALLPPAHLQQLALTYFCFRRSFNVFSHTFVPGHPFDHVQRGGLDLQEFARRQLPHAFSLRPRRSSTTTHRRRESRSGRRQALQRHSYFRATRRPGEAKHGEC